MKLLLIEDDLAVTKALRHGLQRAYVVAAAATGAAGLHEAEVNSYDVIMLDLSLPDMPGLKVCEQLRAGGVATPILVLTAQVDLACKVTLLDAGADDYLVKPFSLEELQARLRVLVRRVGGSGLHSSVLEVADVRLNTATREVMRAGRTVALRRKEFDLLEYLMRHAGRVVTRAALVNHVWDVQEGLWTNAVDVHIKYLRDKIDRPFPTALIKTVHGVGYRLEIPNVVATIP